MRHRITRTAVLLGLAAMTAACHETTSVPASFSAAAGLYVLTTINGQPLPITDRYAPISGSIYLSPTGRAEREVVYRADTGGSDTVAAVGTFHFVGGAIVLELRPKQGPSSGSWTIHGSLDRGRLMLGYPGPADGFLNEEYLRQW